MSLANLLQQNDYQIYCESISIKDGEPINAYYSDTLTLNATYEDGTTDTWACLITRIGDVVNFTIPYKTKTLGTILTANRFIGGGEIPVQYRPTSGSSSGDTTVHYGPAYISINGTRSFGVFDIKSNGALDIYSNVNLAAPTAGQAVAQYKQVFTWYIN